jgi:hypothetical protein
MVLKYMCVWIEIVQDLQMHMYRNVQFSPAVQGYVLNLKLWVKQKVGYGFKELYQTAALYMGSWCIQLMMNACTYMLRHS